MSWTPTESQARVLDADTDLLVVGRPGTGKTTVALAKAAGFVERNLKPHQQVLFISFSNAAVQRIQASARLGLPRSVRTRIQILTFHGLCYQFLRAHARRAGIPSPFSLLPPEAEKIIRVTEKDGAEAEFARIEREEGRVRFDRFGPLTLEILTRHPVLRRAYTDAHPLIVVDEYQDTDDVQDELAELLGRPGILLCLGDPEQQIFNWRPGTREDRLDRLLERGHATRIDLVGPNHRSGDSDLLRYARAVLEGRPTVEGCKSVQVWGVGKGNHVADLLKKALLAAESKVRRVLGDNHYRPTVAVLARTNSLVGRIGTHLRTPSEAFPREFTHQVMVSFEELKFSWRIALLALELGKAECGRACLALMFEEMAQMETWAGNATALDHATKLTAWAQKLREHPTGGTAASKKCVERLEQIARNRTGKALEDLHAVVGVLREVSGGHFKRAVSVLDRRLPAGPNEPLGEEIEGTYAASGMYCEASSLVEPYLLRERLTDGAQSSSRRQVMTLHKCKGKEFDAVIVVDDFAGPGRLASLPSSGEQRFAEDRRLLSVGITRARICVGILTPAFARSALLPIEVWPTDT